MFPFLHDYPYSDLHEIDLAYMQMLVAAIEGNNKQLLAWKATHEKEYAELSEKVEGLINNLVDVIVPWDSSIAYHIFSIVEYQGTNYIAVQDVPVGTMITNTDYWQPANTVVEQINAIGQTVNDVYKDIRNVINLKKRGADNTGTDDISAILISEIAANPHGTFYFPAGIYKLDSTIDLPASCEIMLDTDAKIKVTSAIDYVFKLSNDGNREEYTDVFGLKHYRISGGIIDCNNLAKDCIIVESTYFTKIENVRVRDFTRYGISIAPSRFNLAACNVEHCVIWGNGTSDCGIYDNGNDNNVYFTTVTNCKEGFHSKNDFYLGCSVWTDETGTYEGSNGYVSENAIHIVGCTADTVQRGIYLKANAQATAEDFQVINNNAVATPDTNTYIIYAEATNNRLYYNNIVIQITSSYSFCNHFILLAGKTINDTQKTAVNAPWDSHNIVTSEATITASYRYVDGEMILAISKTSGNAVQIDAWANITLFTLPVTATLKYLGGLKNEIVIDANNNPAIISLQITTNGEVKLVNDTSSPTTINRAHLSERYITLNY